MSGIALITKLNLNVICECTQAIHRLKMRGMICTNCYDMKIVIFFIHENQFSIRAVFKDKCAEFRD